MTTPTYQTRADKSSVEDAQRHTTGDAGTTQFVDQRTETRVQRKLQALADNSPRTQGSARLQAIADRQCMDRKPAAQHENRTGLPDVLKAAVESMSGYSLDDVSVHYHSDQPAQFQALAFARGTDIHVAPAQEGHLAHEAWHVVQQKQGRVEAQLRTNHGESINDDEALETEADVMGALAVQRSPLAATGRMPQVARPAVSVVQRRTVGDRHYTDFAELEGSRYVILRAWLLRPLLLSSKYRLFDREADLALPRIWNGDEARLLARRFGEFYGEEAKNQARNLDAVIASLLAGLEGVTVADFLTPIRLMNQQCCVQIETLANTGYTFWRAIGGDDRYLFNEASDRALSATLVANQTAEIRIVFGHLAAARVANLDDLVIAIDKACSLGIPVDVSIARLQAIHDNISNVVMGRLATDHAEINAMLGNVLDAVFANAFQSLEIPGSDPHKGGQVVVFVNYRTLAGQNLRVVYKPGDLRLDALLFGSADSVAAKLGGGLGTYAMRPHQQDGDPRLAHYGYLQFVASGGPTTPGQLRSVYCSVGENLAIACVFGLRDIHHDNFILLDDHIQLIDLEAATTRFSSFGEMELASLPKALSSRIAKVAAAAGLRRKTLEGWKKAHDEAAKVSDEILLNEIRNGFANALDKMSSTGMAHGVRIGEFVSTIAQAETRFVPFSTLTLQQDLVALFFGRLPAGPLAVGPTRVQFDATTERIAAEAAALAAQNPEEPTRERLGPGVLKDQLLALLRADSTRAAINAGDVPFWSRRGDSVYGDDGVRIVEHMNHPRLATAADNEARANERRSPGHSAEMKAKLVEQAIPLFAKSFSAILSELR